MNENGRPPANGSAKPGARPRDQRPPGARPPAEVRPPAGRPSTRTALPLAFTPITIAGLTLRNRVVRAGCFEGLSSGGLVTDRLIEHHRRVAAGGVAMTTLSYCAVSADGRAFAHELWMRPELLPGLAAFTRAVHAEGAAACLQLGHCGFFASPRVIGRRPLGASPKLCLYRLSRCQPMTAAELSEKTADFARAALWARECGFDAIELHAGHGYLLSQFLSPWTNRRRDEYGGSLSNRLRFPLQVLAAVREAVGPDFPLLVKMNVRDGMSGGLELPEAIAVARAFAEVGASALIPSCGFTARTPLYMLRGGVPTKEMARAQTSRTARLGTACFGRLLVQRYPFAPRFLENEAARIRRAVDIPVGYVGGVTSLADIEHLLGSGFAFVQVGRATIRDPDFVARLRSGEGTVSDCDHCNRCVAAMSADGVRCYLSFEEGADETGIANRGLFSSLGLFSSVRRRFAVAAPAQSGVTGEPPGSARQSPGTARQSLGSARQSTGTALVTGACSGIGLAIAGELARRDYALVLVSNREAELSAVGARLAAEYGVAVDTISLDLAQPEAAEHLYDLVKARGLAIDILVSNAGILLFGEATGTSPEQAQRLLQLHVVTPTLLALLFGREMRNRRKGHLLFVSSLSALRDFPGIALYGSSKRYLLSLANALREELRPWGVGVTCVLPGAVATNLYCQTSVPVTKAVKYRVMIQPAYVARVAVEGMLRGKESVIPGFSARVMGWLMRLTPRWVIRLVQERSGLLPTPADLTAADHCRKTESAGKEISHEFGQGR